MKYLLLLPILLVLGAGFVAAQKEETSEKVRYVCDSEALLKRLPTDSLQLTLLQAISMNDVECVKRIFATTKLNPNFSLTYRDGSISGPPILTAASKNAEIVNELIKAGLDIKAEEINFALFIAANTGQLEIIKLLIKAGANIDGRTMSETPLMQAVANNRQEVVDFLLASKADVNAATDNGITSLMGAGNNPAIVKTLLKAGAKIDVVDKEGRSALFFAVELVQIEKLKVLLENGANVGLKDKTGQTAFAMTEKIEDTEKRSEIINLLKKHEAK